MGPTGLMATAWAAAWGLKTLCVEQLAEPLDIPRAISFDDEIMRMFHRLGLEKELTPVAKPVPGMQLLSPSRRVLLTFVKKPVAHFATTYLFFQPALEDCLENHLRKNPLVTLLRSTSVTAIAQDARGVMATLQPVGESSVSKVAASFLLACDGANSVIRAWCNLAWKDIGYRAANFKMDILTEQPFPGPQWIQKTCDPRKPVVYLPGVGNHVRWELSLKQKTAPPLSELTGQLLPHTPHKVLHAKTYHFRSAMATQWQQGHIFLAGDAAHTMPPYLGQGMCAGFRDVQNLLWKMALVLQHGASEKLLATYETERKAHVRFVMTLTHAVGWVFTTYLSYLLQAAAWLLPKTWREIQISAPVQTKGLYSGKGLSGRQLPMPLVLNSAGQTLTLDAWLGNHLTLLCKHEPGEVNPDLLEQWRAYGGKVAVVHASFQPDTPGVFPTATEQPGGPGIWDGHPYTYLLVRPDGMVYGACKGKKINALMARFLKALGGKT